MDKNIGEMINLIRRREVAITDTDLFELVCYLYKENKRLEKSNRNWRRKCQRLRSKENQNEEKEKDKGISD